jgi:protein-tyrosine phosphatase
MSPGEPAGACVTLDGITSRAELHFHLLPGVDDGPRDLGEALELARMAVADGTGLVTATPHVRDATLDEIPGRVAELRAEIERARIPLAVLGGAEVAFDDVPEMTDAELHAVAQGPAGRRWVLLEAPLWSDDLGAFTDAVDEVRARGLGVLIGHPERCEVVRETPAALDRLLAEGCRAQVNATSLLGRHGDEARDNALALVRTGRAHVIASDAHRPRRGPSLSAALDVLEREGVERARAERLVGEHPAALLRQGLPARVTRARAA